MNKCLTCRHWKKDKADGIVGKCVQLDELRFQFEGENMFCKYEFGENRKPTRERYRPQLLEEKPMPKPTTTKTTPYYQIKAAERKQKQGVVA